MHINQASRQKMWWLAGLFLTISVAIALLIWQLQLAYLGRALVTALMTENPCAAPCWQGIIPGETSRTQALRLLKESPYVLQDSLREAGNSESGGVIWQWRTSGRRVEPGVSWQNDVVQTIILGLTHDLTVGQIIDKFGPPEALEVVTGGIPEHWYWIIILHYPHNGIEFQAYTVEYSNTLTPSTKVEVIHLFVPTSLEERVANKYGQDIPDSQSLVSHVLNLMRPWKGYGDLFELYYSSPQELLMKSE